MIEKQAKRKKIFYVPGMISLIFIPLFCFYHFYKIDAFTDERCMDFIFPPKEQFKKYEVEHLRKYKVFSFTTSKAQELDKLKELRFFVRELVTKYDTINGAKIHFASKTDYDTFISVLDVLNIEKVQTWVLHKDDIYVLKGRKPKPSKYRIHAFWCGNGEANREYFLEVERKQQLENVLALYKKHWILFLGYLGIVLLNIFTLVKFNKNK